MPLVISQNLVLSTDEAAIPDGTPLILYDNKVTSSNVTATSEQDEYPVTNLANPATNQEWRAVQDSPLGAEESIDVDIDSVDLVDGVGIARHNFGSAGIAVSIYATTADSPGDEVLVAGPQIPANDEPLLFHFTARSFEILRIVLDLSLATEAPRAAVVYAGKILICQRSFDVGQDFTPPRFARKTDRLVGTSERGDYLGRIVTSQYIEGATFNWKHFTPDWYRTYFDPFVEAAQQDVPFFFAWQPDDYPYEVSFGWLTEDPMPVTSPVTGRKSVSIRFGGIVE